MLLLKCTVRTVGVNAMAHIECYKNHGIDYLRICEAVYIPNLKRQKKRTIKNIGPLSKYDDGKPDFKKCF